MRRQAKRGFSLVVVTVVLAVMSVAAVMLMNMLGLDLDMVGTHRKAFQAHGVAEAALIETINSRDVALSAPTFTTPGLVFKFDAPAASALKDSSLGQDYRVQIRLLRVAPMAESSITWSRALIYEATARAEAAHGDAEAEVVGEVFRIVSITPGTQLPQMHGR
ncbi:MAG: hypothetical protein IT384_14295 [Deltaproteobacteria bacterium]|nr:hypothetical protein [Deltaproteobacteria bacterium]